MQKSIVDNDPLLFPADVLRAWKAQAESLALAQVGKTAREIPGTCVETPPARLRIELPEPVNPIAHRSYGGTHVTAWRFRLRLISLAQPLDIVELRVMEKGVGEWVIGEMFQEPHSRPLALPISVERATEFWIDASSPQTWDVKPTSPGRITLWIRDHTQAKGEAHIHVVENPPMR